jgi:hypothetical protein
VAIGSRHSWRPGTHPAWGHALEHVGRSVGEGPEDVGEATSAEGGEAITDTVEEQEGHGRAWWSSRVAMAGAVEEQESQCWDL